MKKPPQQKLITKQVSRKLEDAKAFAQASKGIQSWINYVREGLGMSVSQLAARAGVSQSTMTNAIKSEAEGRMTIHKLREIADALECDLVYTLVPRKKLEDVIQDQAVKKTRELMKASGTHMALEDQQVTRDEGERLKELAEERVYSKYLWDK